MEKISRRRAGGGRGPRPSLAKERFWRDHVARQAAEGISVRAYCRRRRLNEPSFYAWRRELARRDRARQGAASRAVGFVRLDASPEGMPVGPVIELVLPREVRVRVPAGAARSHLREVLAALGVAAIHADEESPPC